MTVRPDTNPSSGNGAEAPRARTFDVAIGIGVSLLAFGLFVQEVAIQAASESTRRWASLLSELTGIAGETLLVFTSGALAAYLMTLAPPLERRRQARAIATGALVVLTLGQVLLRLTEFEMAIARTSRGSPLTNAIAIGALLSLPLTLRLGARGLLVAAGGLYLTGWLVRVHVPVTQGPGSLLVELLTGPRSINLDYGHAFLQWSGILLAGCALGKSLAAGATPLARLALLSRVKVIALSVMAMAIALRAATLLPAVRAVIGAPEWLSVFAVLQAAPMFAALFGSASVMLFCQLWQWGERQRHWNASAPLARLGQAGFYAWVVQSFIFRDVVARLDLSETWSWPLVLLGSAAAIWWLVGLLPANVRPRVFQLGIV